MKKIVFVVFMYLFMAMNVFAADNKVAIKIMPLEKISTANDEIEVGDKVPFKVIDDVYRNKRLFIKKDTTMYGTVDFVKENGWFGNNAQVGFKTFRVRNTAGKLTTFNSELSLDGFDTLKWFNPKWKRFFNYCSIVFRGNEVDINPKTSNPEFEIWYQYK